MLLLGVAGTPARGPRPNADGDFQDRSSRRGRHLKFTADDGPVAAKTSTDRRHVCRFEGDRVNVDIAPQGMRALTPSGICE
jgi:hypothetical protein